jgi:hypothetical protein
MAFLLCSTKEIIPSRWARCGKKAEQSSVLPIQETTDN